MSPPALLDLCAAYASRRARFLASSAGPPLFFARSVTFAATSLAPSASIPSSSRWDSRASSVRDRFPSTVLGIAGRLFRLAASRALNDFITVRFCRIPRSRSFCSVVSPSGCTSSCSMSASSAASRASSSRSSSKSCRSMSSSTKSAIFLPSTISGIMSYAHSGSFKEYSFRQSDAYTPGPPCSHIISFCSLRVAGFVGSALTRIGVSSAAV
mmetsp:Transcript_14413/g.31029  ORF Transcript_14413/g.31029 Transcript_14413/m.31029 type:complete len:212 (-) Transcript_14413:1239-1874(-)